MDNIEAVPDSTPYSAALRRGLREYRWFAALLLGVVVLVAGKLHS